MEIYISCTVFLFGILTWIPFLNGVFGHDVVTHMYWVNRIKKGNLTLYKQHCNSAIGHYLHIFFLQLFWEKYNTKAFYWFMCLYTSTSSLILFWVLFQLFGLLPAISGSMLFSLYIASPRMDGNWGPFEQLIPLPLFGSILCILTSSYNDPYIILLGGMLLGYSILIKQHSVLYLPGYFLMIAGTGHSLYHHLVFLCGIVITNLIPLIYYWLRHNAFWEYLVANWLFLLPTAINPKKYNKLYPEICVRGEKDPEFRKRIIINNSRSLLPILFLSVIGIFVLFSYHFSLLYLGLFASLIVSASMIFMRGTFFPHYWLNTIPWLAIFSGFGVSEIIHSLVQLGPPDAVTFAGILAVILLFLDALCVDRKYYVFSKDPYQFLRKVWGEGLANRYKLWKQIGEYIRNTTKPDDRILICGHAPHILLYSDRTHFTVQDCLYTKDYLEIYNRDNPNYLDFLNSIYKFKNFKLIKQSENVFHKGYPEIIVFAEELADITGFENLTGIKYSHEQNMDGILIFQADMELTELMKLYESTKSSSLRESKDMDSNEDRLFDSIDTQDWNTALKVSKQLLARDPYNIKMLLALGDCLIGSGNYKLLFNFYNRLMENKVVSSASIRELLNKLGEAYCNMNKFNEAEELFHEILKLNPDNTTVLNNLGFVYSKQNDNGKALEYFQKALELDPNNEDAKLNLINL